jgi:hypothetical protein
MRARMLLVMATPVVVTGLVALALVGYPAITPRHAVTTPFIRADHMIELPAITMTAGGGFEANSRTWTIAPDGSWTFVANTKRAIGTGVEPSPTVGRLTDRQRQELAALANDPSLQRELRAPHRPCEVSDGSDERLTVAEIRYTADWCGERRPHIATLRDRIAAFTGQR